MVKTSVLMTVHDREPEVLLALTTDFVQRTGFEGIAPLPKEVSSTIANARRLPKVVVW